MLPACVFFFFVYFTAHAAILLFSTRSIPPRDSVRLIQRSALCINFVAQIHKFESHDC